MYIDGLMYVWASSVSLSSALIRSQHRRHHHHQHQQQHSYFMYICRFIYNSELTRFIHTINVFYVILGSNWLMRQREIDETGE